MKRSSLYQLIQLIGQESWHKASIFFHQTSTEKRLYSFYPLWKFGHAYAGWTAKNMGLSLKESILQPTRMTFCIDFSLMMYIKKRNICFSCSIYGHFCVVILKGYCLRFTKKMVPSLAILSHHFPQNR